MPYQSEHMKMVSELVMLKGRALGQGKEFRDLK
jgi:hypothetical protein